MYARISRYQGDAELLRSGFESVSEELAQIDGFSHAMFLADRGTSRAMSITLWETKAAMEASAERAHQMRTRASEPAQATIESVEGYELLLTVEATTSA